MLRARQRRVDLLGALDHGAAGGQQAASLVGGMPVQSEVGLVEAIDQRGAVRRHVGESTGERVGTG
jgi:hypothetical protein